MPRNLDESSPDIDREDRSRDPRPGHKPDADVDEEDPEVRVSRHDDDDDEDDLEDLELEELHEDDLKDMEGPDA